MNNSGTQPQTRDVVVLDFADAKREIERLREKLANEIRGREQLLSVVSHELRTPITVIRGYNNLLLGEDAGALTDNQRHFVEESNRSCSRLNRFVGDLLSACADARAGIQVALERESLEPLLEGVVSYLRPVLDERNLKLELDLDEKALWGRFDASRIEQVLTNLLSNATRYSRPKSTVRVESHVLEGGARDEIAVSVIDTGPGVPPAERDRIFEPYVRAADDRSSGGLGLGLAICKRIIDAHGGTIRVEGEPGAGSRFTFTLQAANMLEASC